MSNLFQSSTIPVLEQVATFAQARHTVLAGNLANIDTPGYVSQDLSVEDFQQRLKQAINVRHQPGQYSPGAGYVDTSASMATVAKDSQGILFHDQSNVGTEYQVSEMVKNRLQHNLAITILSQQFRLLQSAISEKA
jgi:flagellar basal-body rod protein FlgB